MNNLKTESKYWFRATALTSKGIEPWSEPIMKIVS
jgi:hypothetical protein